MIPTRAPVAASAMARFVATVDLPTPPFPLETAMMRPRFGYGMGVGADGRGAAAGAAFITGSVRAAGGGGGGALLLARDSNSAGSRTSTRASVTPSTDSTA